jgi:geranylgeranyl diphosphate synthase type 3
MELYWRDSFHCPTEDEYKQMTIRKTGSDPTGRVTR